MATIAELTVPATPPDLLAGWSSVEWVNRQLRWLFSAFVAWASLVASVVLLWDPWRIVGIWASALVGIACGVPLLQASVNAWQALQREHAAGYTTLFGGGYRYWQLEAKTGKVLRRPGERTVHREGIPRELLAREAEVAAERDVATGVPE